MTGPDYLPGRRRPRRSRRAASGGRRRRARVRERRSRASCTRCSAGPRGRGWDLGRDVFLLRPGGGARAASTGVDYVEELALLRRRRAVRRARADRRRPHRGRRHHPLTARRRRDERHDRCPAPEPRRSPLDRPRRGGARADPALRAGVDRSQRLTIPASRSSSCSRGSPRWTSTSSTRSPTGTGASSSSSWRRAAAAASARAAPRVPGWSPASASRGIFRREPNSSNPGNARPAGARPDPAAARRAALRSEGGSHRHRGRVSSTRARTTPARRRHRTAAVGRSGRTVLMARRSTSGSGRRAPPAPGARLLCTSHLRDRTAGRGRTTCACSMISEANRIGVSAAVRSLPAMRTRRRGPADDGGAIAIVAGRRAAAASQRRHRLGVPARCARAVGAGAEASTTRELHARRRGRDSNRSPGWRRARWTPSLTRSSTCGAAWCLASSTCRR